MDTNSKRRTIGLIIDDVAGWGFGDYIQSNVIAGAAAMARKHDANVLCFAAGNLDSHNEWVRGRNILFEFIDADKVDGLIALTTSIGLRVSRQRVLEKLAQYKGIPIVTIGDTFEEHYSVSIPNYQGMCEALEHIILHHDRRKIAFIKGAPGSKEAEDRFRAYRDTLAKYNIPYDERLVFQGNFLFESGASAILALHEQQITYDAVVAANDSMAIGALTEIHKIDGKLPEHLSIVGFDDIEPSEMLSLTTVKQSFYTEAETAVDMLIRVLKGEDVRKNQETHTHLVVRSSCGCIPRIIAETTLDVDSIAIGAKLSIDQLKDSFMAHMDHMAEATPGAINPDVYRAIRCDLEHLPDALVQELFFEKDKMFFYAWRSIIFHAIQHKIDLSFMHNALSFMRVLTLHTVTETADGSAKAENLFQMARVQISEAVQRTSFSLSYMSSLLSNQLEQLGEQLGTHLDMSGLQDVIVNEFPKHGIHEGYICLYENPDKPLDRARLMLAYRNGERMDADANEVCFPTAQLLPLQLRARLEDYRHQFIVQTLHLSDHHIGYVLFSFDTAVNKAHDLLRYRLSNVLRVSRLLHDVQKHSLELESQVIARTKELSLLNEELHKQSIRDDLTGLLNRRGFMRRGQEAFEEAACQHARLLLVFADLDNLKKINDNFGHSEGDLAIQMTAEVLKKAFGPDDIISRLAGDEFTVIVEGPTSLAGKTIRRNIEEETARMNQKHGKPFKLSISIGFAEYHPDHPCTFDKLMRLADEALYREKKGKKKAT
ncbi:diguanylate cyclase domain-containing protein [Xylanibacillus composti]|uniref:GGDEF domain-containing protein n=1 Tax=Xylanibacillus composti TaxID=1572762 RepID=A0A8J4H5M9_9BACL|nr:GGDEF domain-containing protein [Xylanibacillus composti]GIQ69128.1 hypothetical protein XYCOK13_19520 [Xylanibacillus composti]